MKEEKTGNHKIQQIDDPLSVPDQLTENEIRDEIANAVPTRLLNYLRQEIGDSELEYAVPPKPMTNGNASVRIFGFELTTPPEGLAGPLVLRMKPGDEQSLTHEVALMDAARRLGCKVPRIRLSEPDSKWLGGPFFIMDRVVGRGILRWLITPTLIGLVASLVLWNIWPLLAGYLFGSVVVGVTLRLLQRKLHSLPIEEVKEICHQHDLKGDEMEINKILQGHADFMNSDDLEAFLPGMRWLHVNQPEVINPKLCHGDFHLLNVLGTWTKVTGIIDWEGARIASPELDLAHFRCLATIEAGIVGIILFFPTYLILRACQGKDLDQESLRYYLALDSFMRSTGLTSYLIKNTKNGESGLRWIEKVFVVSRIKSYTRFYKKLTAVELPSLTEITAKRISK